MRMLFSGCVATLISIMLLSGRALADKPVEQSSEDKKPTDDRTVFVTGSLIPKRIKLKPIGTNTTSPVRIIDRREIDQTGRVTTPGIFVTDPSVRVTGR